MIVPTLQRGNAAQDAPRPLWRVTQTVTGCMPTRSMGTISVGSGLIVPTLQRGNAAQDAPRPLWRVTQ
ncbi:hypothetical protein, partial [Pseudomonas viridiflava]|uniref:hypothetical protein n=1 Tax=Pseudomonas viridiflava TaxID=33069 RepID=UPI00197EC348